jgi:hypothetical protein
MHGLEHLRRRKNVHERRLPNRPESIAMHERRELQRRYAEMRERLVRRNLHDRPKLRHRKLLQPRRMRSGHATEAELLVNRHDGLRSNAKLRVRILPLLVRGQLDLHAHRQSHSDLRCRRLLRGHELGRRDSMHAAKRLHERTALHRQHLQVNRRSRAPAWSRCASGAHVHKYGPLRFSLRPAHPPRAFRFTGSRP